MIQVIGGTDIWIYEFPYVGVGLEVRDINPSRTILDFENISIYQTETVEVYTGGRSKPPDPDIYEKDGRLYRDEHVGPYDAHTDLDSEENWDTYVEPQIEENH